MVSGGFWSPWRRCFYFYSQQLSDFSAYSRAWSSHGQVHWPLLILCCSPEADEIVSSSSWFSLAFWSPPASRLLLLPLPLFPFTSVSTPFSISPGGIIRPNHEQISFTTGGWSCSHESKFDGGMDRCLFLLSKEYLVGLHGLWLGRGAGITNSLAFPVCLYARFCNTSSTADLILLGGGGDLSWQRPQHRLILEISSFTHLLLAFCFYINSALQSLLLFCPVSREIACRPPRGRSAHSIAFHDCWAF